VQKENRLVVKLNAERYISEIDFSEIECCRIDANVNNNYPPIHSFVTSMEDHKMSAMSKKLKDNFTILEGEPFDPSFTHKEKMFGVYENHLKCIQLAYDNNLDHVFIFEDDVYFIKNWRNIVNEFIYNNEVDILKFDLLPYNVESNCSDNKIVFYKRDMGCCLGGYYLSKNAINIMLSRHSRLLKLLESHEGDSGTETLWGFLAEPFEDEIYTSLPRICIQDWFSQNKSNLQTNDHLKNLVEMQEKYYLPKYKHFYPELQDENI